MRLRKRRAARCAAFVLLMLLLCACAAPAASDAVPTSSDAVSESGTALGYGVIPAREQAEPDGASAAQEPEPAPETETASEEGGSPEATLLDPIEETVQRMLRDMTLEERVAQMFFISCPPSGMEQVLEKYPLGGCILFSYNLSGLTADEVRDRIESLQEKARIPLLIGADEEGGTVVRVSSNPNLRAARFPSPRSLYAEGGMERVLETEREKAELLLSLGINVNLAPVCDVTADPDSFMYARSISGDPEIAAEFAARVTAQMAEQGIAWVMKHYPGYGECGDTHESVIRDESDLAAFTDRSLPPFRAGAENGMGGVLVSHNIVNAFDSELPASLSPAVHELLRAELGDGIVVLTDDLDMKGITAYTDGNEAVVRAILAGNDMLLTSDYKSVDVVTDAVRIGTIPETMIDASCARILRWKIALGLIAADPDTDRSEE